MQWHRGDQPDLYRHFAMRRGRWKLLNSQRAWEPKTPANDPPVAADVSPRLEPYDLVADPREETNLVAEHPDVVKSMRADYESWFRDVSSTRPNNHDPPRIVLGSDQQPVVVLTRPGNASLRVQVDDGDQNLGPHQVVVTIANEGERWA